MHFRDNCELNFGGDMNLNLLTPSDPNVRRYTDNLKGMGVKQLISEAAHYVNNHFVCSDPLLYLKTAVITHGESDHYIVFANRKKPIVEHQKDRYYG